MQGLEPQLADSESAVLPLDDTPIVLPLWATWGIISFNQVNGKPISEESVLQATLDGPALDLVDRHLPAMHLQWPSR